MAIDDEILKTLQKIEKAISSQSNISNNTQKATRAAIAGSKSGNASQSVNTRAATKELQLFTTATGNATTALGGFKSKVRGATSLINSLNKALRKYTPPATSKKEDNQQPLNVPDTEAFSNAVDKITNRLSGSNGLFKQLTTLTAHVRLLNKNAGPSNQSPISNTANLIDAGAKTPEPEKPKPPNEKHTLSSILKSGAITSAVMSSLSGIKNIAGVVIFEDMFQRLAARGYGTTDALGTLYTSAIMAGMSLAEYNKMLDESMISVSRFSSFKAFNAELEKSRGELAKFGIFGIEAAEMTGAMISNSSALGIRTSDANTVVEQQIKVFEKLRKTTNITAEEFRDLARRMQDDDDVQRELIGLSYSQKAARIVELQQVSTLGKAMNLTAAGSEKLRNALEQQRKSSLKDRFQQAGIIRQTAAITGMSSIEANELAKLSLKKRKTPEENTRFLELNARQVAAIEAMQNSGDKTQEFLADQLTARREAAGLGAIDTAAVAAANAQAAGSIINENLNKLLSPFEQQFGKIVAVFEGLAKNPIGTAAVNLISTAFSALLSGGIFALLVGGRISAAVTAALLPVVTAANAAIAAAKGLPIPSPGGPDVGTSKNAGKGRNVGRLIGGTAGLLSLGVTAFGAASDIKNAEQIAANRTGDEAGDTGRVKGEAIGDVAGTVIGTAIGGALSAFTGGLAAAFLLPLGGMLGGWIGKMAGGWAGSRSATEKNTEEIRKNTEAQRAGADSNEIASTNLQSLAENVLKTGKAFYGGQKPQEEKPQITNALPPKETPAVPTMGREISQAPEIVATPVNVLQKTISPPAQKTAPETTINKPQLAQTETPVKEATQSAPDQTVMLTQILGVMQEALQLFKAQAEQREAILRSLSSNKLSDNSQAIKNALLF